LTEALPLSLHDALPIFQRLRDEAHRFAVGSHRTRRRKTIGVSPLDEIAGIGTTRKRALLRHFGSAKAVSRASVQDLAAVEGISRSEEHTSELQSREKLV